MENGQESDGGGILDLVARLLAVALLALLAGTAAAGPTAPLPQAPGCPVFPATNVWNQRVDALPVAAGSSAIVAAIGPNDRMHADFGSGLWDGGPIGIPVTVVRGTQRTVRVAFEYAPESDKGPYPIPANVAIEGGRRADGDRHVIVVDRAACKLYELFDAHPLDAGRSWRAGSGATWDLRSNRLRTKGWTSADAAGLPILPGLARYEEVAQGAINHALRFTAPRTRTSFAWPARHQAGSSSDPSLPPMGLRVRLKRSTSLRGLPRQARVIATAMKRYGLMLADNGSPWYVTGAPHPRWDNDQLRALGRLRGRDFEVVDASSLRPR